MTKREREVVDAAREFVAATSWYRQRKDCRDAFERLAFALLAQRAEEDRRIFAVMAGEPFSKSQRRTPSMGAGGRAVSDSLIAYVRGRSL